MKASNGTPPSHTSSVLPGSAVGEHEPRPGPRSDGHQVQVPRVRWPQVSFTHQHTSEGSRDDPSRRSDFMCPSSSSEQVLHLWLEVLCSSVAAVEKWYHPWSFLRSPGWVQIKCELRWEADLGCKYINAVLMCVAVCCLLRVLSKFAFSLSQDCELPEKKEVRGFTKQKPGIGQQLGYSVENNDLVLFQKSAYLKAEAVDMLIQHHLFSWDI